MSSPNERISATRRAKTRQQVCYHEQSWKIPSLTCTTLPLRSKHTCPVLSCSSAQTLTFPLPISFSILTPQKGSRLKADAPEFVPTLFTATPRDSLTKPVSDGSPSKTTSKGASRLQKQMEKDERKAASLAKKAGKKVVKQIQGRRDDFMCSMPLTITDSRPTTADESSSAVGPSNGPMTDAESSAADKSKTKRVRFPSRRHLAKSEPPNRSLDGQQDDDLTAVSSNETQPLMQNFAIVGRL